MAKRYSPKLKFQIEPPSQVLADDKVLYHFTTISDNDDETGHSNERERIEVVFGRVWPCKFSRSFGGPSGSFIRLPLPAPRKMASMIQVLCRYNKKSQDKRTTTNYDTLNQRR